MSGHPVYIRGNAGPLPYRPGTAKDLTEFLSEKAFSDALDFAFIDTCAQMRTRAYARIVTYVIRPRERIHECMSARSPFRVNHAWSRGGEGEGGETARAKLSVAGSEL